MIKNIILAILALVAIICIWVLIRNSAGLQLSTMQGKTAKLSRGSLTIPISANGIIEPKDRMTIKSEAGGTVAEIPFEVGQIVTKGELLIKLSPEDEQRVFDIATKALKTTVINFKRAQANMYQREKVDLPSSIARLKQIQAELKYSQFAYDRTEDFKKAGHADEDEMERITSQHFSLQARRDQAEAEVDRAKSNIELAQLDLEQAELAVERAKDDLAEARERLAETEIIAPVGGMISKLYVKEGEVIVSGSRSLTGGTPLGTLADVGEFYVKALVDEADIGRVREIAPLHARPGYSGEAFAGDSQNSSDQAHKEPGPGEDPEKNTVELDSRLGFEQGTSVKVSVEAFPDDEFEGVIDLIEPEPQTGQVVISYIVRIRLTSANSDKLLIGMQANVQFVSQSVKNAILVPNEAVKYVASERGIYLQVDSEKVPGKKVPKFVAFRAGLDNGMYTEVISGLEEGDVAYIKLPRNRYGQEITEDVDE